LQLKRAREDCSSIGTALSLKVNSTHALSSKVSRDYRHDSHCNLFEDSTHIAENPIGHLTASRSLSSYNETIREAYKSSTQLQLIDEVLKEPLIKRNHHSEEQIHKHENSNNEKIAAIETETPLNDDLTYSLVLRSSSNKTTETEHRNPLKFTEVSYYIYT
jgi:hypothetical protein